MTEFSETPPPIAPREILYQGFHNKMCEVTSQTTDVARIGEIEKSVGTEYGDTDPQGDMKAWLNAGVTRKFDSVSFAGNPQTQKQMMVGVSEASAPTDEIVMAARNTDNRIDGYTLTYRSPANEALLPEELATMNASVPFMREVSYVTDTPDAERNHVQVAEAFVGTSLVLAERALGREPHQFTGEFTAEEIAQVDALLKLYSIPGAGDDEANYRKGLELAGFKNYGEFTDPSEEGTFLAYSASFADITSFQTRRAATQ